MCDLSEMWVLPIESRESLPTSCAKSLLLKMGIRLSGVDSFTALSDAAFLASSPTDNDQVAAAAHHEGARSTWRNTARSTSTGGRRSVAVPRGSYRIRGTSNWAITLYVDLAPLATMLPSSSSQRDSVDGNIMVLTREHVAGEPTRITSSRKKVTR